MEMDVKSIARGLAENIEKVLVGKHRTVELVLTALLAGGHILVEDVPGVGKTTLGERPGQDDRLRLYTHTVYAGYPAK